MTDIVPASARPDVDGQLFPEAAAKRPAPVPLPEALDPAGDGTTTAVRVVLDTSALISDPESLLAFPEADAVIPLVVVEELDSQKTRMDDVGRAARHVIRTIEELRVANGGDIRRPVRLPGGGTLRIETNGLMLDEVASRGLDPNKADNRLLAAALGQARHAPTTIVSNDAALRIKAAQVGLQAIEHHRGRRDLSPDAARAHGWHHLDVTGNLVDQLFDRPHGLPIDDVAGDDADACSVIGENEFAVFRAGASQSALARRHRGELVPIVRAPDAWGLHPRSKEQQFALDLLLDPDVPVVALDGMAGTGKTIMAIAAGLQQVVESPIYDKVAVYRPVVPVGKSELGFLPGSLEEKLDPWMTAVTDALVALTETRSHADARSILDELTSRNKLSLETVTYLRGRSLQDTFIVVDEAQNLEPTTLKTILTRVGQGTKVVFTGDTSQIDAPYLSEHNNAVSVLVDRFAGESCFGHVRLTHCERSEVASLAATRL